MEDGSADMAGHLSHYYIAGIFTFSFYGSAQLAFATAYPAAYADSGTHNDFYGHTIVAKIAEKLVAALAKGQPAAAEVYR
jgi:hypothetical protein